MNNKTHSDSSALPKENILGVGITNTSKENILEFIIENLQKTQNPYYIVTPNPEMIVLSKKNSSFKKALLGAKIASNDGVGLGLAAKVLGKHLSSRLTGVELVEKLCEKSSDWPITVGFLGGGPKIAEQASERLRVRYPKLKVGFIGEEWPDGFTDEKKAVSSMNNAVSNKEKNKKHTAYSIKRNAQHIDILFVAYGAPKQELWMAERVGKIPAKVLIGIGGAFDQIVHPSLRPPRFLQSIGLGWLYRLVRQPWRIQRQLALIEFMWLVLKEKLSS